MSSTGASGWRQAPASWAVGPVLTYAKRCILWLRIAASAANGDFQAHRMLWITLSAGPCKGLWTGE